MSLKYARHVSAKQTPQSEPVPGKPMVPNSAGGFTFQVDDWTRLDRFLILGNDGGTYYATEQKLTVENAQAVHRCFDVDAKRAVDRIVEISVSGRAPKNDPAIFALALAAAHPKAKHFALSNPVFQVCRTGTHLFQFCAAVDQLRGWGRALRSAVANWYAHKDAAAVAYQCAKYQQRDGWSHRDLLRLSHPKVDKDSDLGHVLHWVVKGWDVVGEEPHDRDALKMIWAFERAKKATTATEIRHLIDEFNLSRECIPTKFLTDASVWEALLAQMPLTALIRNLATMTRVGLIAPMSQATKMVQEKLANAEWLKKSRVHPVAVLAALLTYKQGHGERGSNTWTPVGQVVNALDGAFYAAFGNVESTGKRWMLACDVSGSMESGTIAGVSGLTPRVGTAALAMVTAAVEPQHQFVAFTSDGWSSPLAGRGRWSSQGINNRITPLSISPRQRLDDVCRTMAALPMGGTDCALPMLYAEANNIPVDAFVILTDNETWAGDIHPCQALKQYRQKTGILAKLIVVGMTATGFSIADPADGGMLDVVGFDTNAPAIMSDFTRN